MALTVQEAAVKWGVTEATVRKWARGGRLKAKPLSEVMREKGLPSPKTESWIIFQDERPSLSTEPIVRERALPQEAVAEEAPAPMNGRWW